MNHKKLHGTHKHLTLVFTGVVFAIVLVSGISFLATKYLSENRQQKTAIFSQVQDIILAMRDNDDFFQTYIQQKEHGELKKFRASEVSKQRGGVPRLSFLVLDSDNNLVFQDLLQEIRFEEVSFEGNNIYKDSQTYLFSKDLGNEKVVFYQHVHYSIDDVIQDALLLLLLAILLSGLVYLIGYKFVEKALGPVEENLRDMTDFIHNAGHELKTPLAVMSGNLQVMQAEKAFDGLLVKKSIGEISRMTELIESLRELSELGTLSEKEKIPLLWEIENVRQDFEGMLLSKNIEFLGLTSDAHHVFANKDELHLMLSNTIKNAIKYTPKGGKISVTYKGGVLAITDSGVGIPKDEMEKVFERFYQGSIARSEEGFGIGLSLVKKIADANNWKIALESEQGKGTTFKITF